MTADLQVLQPKVRAEQGKFRSDVYSAMPDNYFDANSAILTYANFCSFVGMKSLLNEAVVQSTTPVSFLDSARRAKVISATEKERQAAAVAEERLALAERQKAAEDKIAAMKAEEAAKKVPSQ